MNILTVVGARPNYVKVAPVVHSLLGDGQVVSIVNTGQHYDHGLSGSFLELLDFPEVDHALGVGSGTHAEQTGAVMVGIERILSEGRHDAVLVPGDVNSTVAAALAAAKADVPVIHLEAGLRSGDWSMPEEVNRVVTDRLSHLLLCHSQEAVDNLAAEGARPDSVVMVGNTMIDSLLRLLPQARATGAPADLGLEYRDYILVTLHRPALVDHPGRLAAVLEVLAALAERLPVVLPLHPRTRARLDASHDRMLERLMLVEPLDYLHFVAFEAAARLVVTDSGGVQEETSALGVPCVTYRTTTERPITVTRGTNELAGVEPDALHAACTRRLDEPQPEARPPIPLWDGHAGARAARAIAAL